MTRCEKNTHFRAAWVILCHNTDMGGRGGQQPGALHMFRWVFFSLAPESDVALHCEPIAHLSSFGPALVAPALALGSAVSGVGHGCALRLDREHALEKKESARVCRCVHACVQACVCACVCVCVFACAWRLHVVILSICIRYDVKAGIAQQFE